MTQLTLEIGKSFMVTTMLGRKVLAEVSFTLAEEGGTLAHGVFVAGWRLHLATDAVGGRVASC